jgi:hypothetical protein
MSKAKVELFQEMLEISKKETLKTAGKVPEGKRFTQTCDGKAHPLWLLGHLANTIDVVGTVWAFGGERALPKNYGLKFAPDFAGGIPITTDPEDYPAWEEIVGHYEVAFDRFLDHCRTIEDSDLPQEGRGRIPEEMKKHFSSIGVILRIMVMHESHHRGQMSMLAKITG